jgi:hypothetical protein
MKSLLLLGTGAAVGYVLGAKAGRERYDQIMQLAGQAQRNAPRSLTDATAAASDKAESLTETARAKAHDMIDLAGEKADAKIDDLADRTQEIREQSKQRVEGADEPDTSPPKAAKKAAPSTPR